MGSTYIDYRGKGFEANDSEIEIWLALMVQEIDKLPQPPDWLRDPTASGLGVWELLR